MEFLETFGCIWSSKEVIKVIIGRAVHGSTLPERRHKVAVPYLSERPYRSDATKSLALFSFGDTKDEPGATCQSDHPRSLPKPGATTRGKLKSRWSGPFKVKEVRPYGAIVLWSTDGRDFTVNGQRVKLYMATAPEEDGVSTPLYDPTPRQPEVARVFDIWVLENALGATSLSDGTKSLRSRATLSQRHLEVARVCDVLEREKWVGSNVPRATPSGRLRLWFLSKPGATSPERHPQSRATSPERHPQVAPRPVQVPMVKKTREKSDAEKQEAERRESALRGKDLSSEQTGSRTQMTSRRQTLAAKKAKEQERKAGKSVAVATDDESGDESADEQAPTKKAKMSKGKEVSVDRDMTKTPSMEEQYHHLLNEVTLTPTRFADLDLLKELGLDSDIEARLGHLKMPKLLTMAYPVYRDVTCQFLPSLEVTSPGVLPLPSNDIYATFGMVSFFVNCLEHYRDWVWYTSDSRTKVGIGGMITPLLQFLNVPLRKDAAGPKFIDGTYLRIATYFSGIFNISQEDFLGEHGSLGPIAPPKKRSVPTRHDEPPREASVPVCGPPRYYFKPHDGVLPPGALRNAHEHIGRIQRWNKAQDRTIEKLKDKCKALSKTEKKQAKTSAKFMKKVADVLTRGGIVGCSSTDFAFANTSVPQPPPQPTDLDSEVEIDEVQSQQWYGDCGSAPGSYYTTFPPNDDDVGASAPTHYP
uniref:Arabidopsis retrotransposon Orf1 C-terminal domain-containing protein n=1 Tax=Brassica oleracea var. oleracea TaxID=109376 RepID=A0A0D3EBI5_BRAOL